MNERFIIHLNVADFAVAVERQVDSRLREYPVIIAPEAASRAAVYDMSEEAYQQGVRKGMALRRALRLCRDAAVLPPHTDRYERAMGDLFKRVLPYSPLIEAADQNGHLFVDVTGTGRLLGPPQDVAWRIRKHVRADTGLDPIWSLAANKLVAKVATRLVKPSGEYVVRPGDEESFLRPLSIHLIPGIGADDLKRFWEFNLTRAGQVADLTRGQLDVLCDNRSQALYDAVRGIDLSGVMPAWQKQPKMRFNHGFGNDTNCVPEVEGVLYGLVEQAGAGLRRQRLSARRAGIILDYSDGKRIIRQAAVKPAAANDIHLFASAKIALKRAWTRRVRIRHLALVCDRLVSAPAQLSLFSESRAADAKKEHLMTALDAIRRRFGPRAIQAGRTFLKAAA